jgi:hypothetical protein
VKRTQNVKYYLAAAVAFLTFAVYLPALQNGFVDWDDNYYVSINPHIRAFDADFFRWAFLDFYSYNWHPLTWISHALDYALYGLNPLGHHLTNILLHAINTFMVVLLIMSLLAAGKERATATRPSESLNDRTILIAAGATGLLFGLHPLHVESVAWVAERKDLLCALFFLLSIIRYGYYASSDAAQQESFTRFFDKHYMLAVGFFILALLSKPMAVTLPAVLLILDWYPFGRIRSFQTFRTACVEKLPFIALSLVSSVVTILAQRSGGAIWEVLPLPTRALVAIRSLPAYLWKMMLPLDLLPFYPHPRNVSLLSFEYLAATAFVIGITIICMVIAKKQRLWLSVWGYYVVTLIPVLGIVQVGGQSMADRYTYLPSLGPFLIIGLTAAWVSRKINAMAGWGMMIKIVSTAVAVLVFVSLSQVTIKQIGRWKNGLELWNYVIEKEPRRVLVAYFHRGNLFAARGQYYEAIEDYNKVIAWNYKEYSKVYISRGLTHLKVGQVEPAIADLKKACDLGDPFGCQALQYVVKNGTLTKDTVEHQRR